MEQCEFTILLRMFYLNSEASLCLGSVPRRFSLDAVGIPFFLCGCNLFPNPVKQTFLMSMLGLHKIQILK